MSLPFKTKQKRTFKIQSKTQQKKQIRKVFFSWQEIFLWIFGLGQYWELRHFILLGQGLPSSFLHSHSGCCFCCLCIFMQWWQHIFMLTSHWQKPFLDKQWQLCSQICFRSVNLIYNGSLCYSFPNFSYAFYFVFLPEFSNSHLTWYA